MPWFCAQAQVAAVQCEELWLYRPGQMGSATIAGTCDCIASRVCAYDGNINWSPSNTYARRGVSGVNALAISLDDVGERRAKQAVTT